MAKIPFEDVHPPHRDGERRTIRNIPINTRRSRKEPLEEVAEPEVINKYSNNYNPAENSVQDSQDLERFSPRRKKFFTTKLYISIAILAIVVFVFLMLNAFSSANILVTPKKAETQFNMAMTVSSAENVSSTSALRYEIIPIVLEKDAQVPASGEEDVARKASAQVMLYNNYSASPEKLIARTRLQTPEGLIFRIANPAVIPGKANGKPGSVQVTVYADEPGDKYNIGLKDFTIPGFSNDQERFKNIYGRSITKADGGFVGKVKKISADDKKAALAQLNESLKQDAEKELASKLDTNLVVLKGGIIYDFSELPEGDASGSNALLRESANAYAVAFNKKEISALIEKNYLKDWGDLPAEISDFSNMSMTFDDQNWRPSKSSVIGVKISGSAEMMADIDGSSIAESLAGKDKSELMNIINQSKSIESAKASVRPVWKQSFPSNASKIKVEIDS